MNWWFPEVGHLLRCNLMIFRGGHPYLFTMNWWFPEVDYLSKCYLRIFRGGPPYLFTMIWWLPEVGPLSLYYELMIFRVNLFNFFITLPSINWGSPPLRTTTLVSTVTISWEFTLKRISTHFLWADGPLGFARSRKTIKDEFKPQFLPPFLDRPSSSFHNSKITMM